MKQLERGVLVVDTGTLLDALQQGLSIAEALARITTTLWDDTAVKLLKTIMADETLMGWLKQIFSKPEVVNNSGDTRTSAITRAAQAAATPAVQSKLEAAGFDWRTVIDNLPMIITLIMTILGRRK